MNIKKRSLIALVLMIAVCLLVGLATTACEPGDTNGCGTVEPPDENDDPLPPEDDTPDIPVDPPTGSTFVDQHGQLRLIGTQLSDKNGNAVQLKGMSSHWIAWYPQYINRNTIGWLVENKGMTLFRVSMGIEPEGHYLEEPEFNKGKVIEAVDACIDLGIYVIIDWHDHNAHKHQAESKAFFEEMATRYGDTPNVIYEIYNEPEQVSWSGVVKPYAQNIVGAIRSIDADNIIVVGTPQWCQKPQDAASDPINANNIMYSVHFYAASHGQWLRDEVDNARNRGAAIFISEWGSSDYTGGANGSIDLTAAKQWVDWMQARKLSWAAWNLADKEETTSILKPGTSGDGNWTDDVFKGHGPFVLENLPQ